MITVSDYVSSNLHFIGTGIGDRSHISKSCYLFIPLVQSLVKTLENLLWWLTWGPVLLYAGLGNETGLKSPVRCALFIFSQQMCQHGVLWPCYKPFMKVYPGEKFNLFSLFSLSPFLLQQCSNSSYLKTAVSAHTYCVAGPRLGIAHIYIIGKDGVV